MPRRVRKLHLILLVVGILVGLTIWRWYSPGSTPTAPPLPNPNGYDDFVKAGSEIIGEPSDAPQMGESSLMAFVRTNAEPLRLARVGLTRPCVVPFDPNIRPQELMAMKSVAQLLAAEGRLAEMQGRSVEAANIYLDAIEMGNATSQGGLIIHRLVGVAIESIGYARLVKVVSSLECNKAKPLVERLQKLEQHRVQWEQVLNDENRYARLELRKIANPITIVTAWWQSRPVKKSAKARHDLALARTRLLMIHLALHCYQLESGQLPQRLEQLSWLRQVPSDPFTGKPFIYTPSGTNWLLYSVGPDRVDDGGRPVPGRATGRTKGDLFFDSPF